jgi:hypothetical protein
MHITRDGGASWQPITPPDLPPFTMISCIEPSPFEPASAYVAATRYKLDDYRPYLYKTSDYGASWQRIDSGIPESDFTRVIRCDPEQPGMLYAGTETGLYLSIDDGASWQHFQLNLPVAPIHDLLVKDGDLIAGTHGRSIWVLDDLSALRQAAGQPAEARLLAPRTTLRPLTGVDWSGENVGKQYLDAIGGNVILSKSPEGAVVRKFLDAGKNPPRGAVITYYLTEDPAAPIKLTITDSQGAEVRSFVSLTAPATDGTPAEQPKGLKAPAKVGWNRFIWDLRWAPATRIEGSDPPAQAEIAGPRVAPGSYTVTLSVGDQSYSQPLTVVKDPAIATDDADLIAQFDLAQRIHRKTDELTKAVNRMRDLRAQLDAWAKRADTLPNVAPIAEAARALRAKVLDVEKTIVVPDLRSGWADSLNHGVRLLEKIVSLPSVVEMGDYKPTAAAEAAFADLTTRIDTQIGAFNILIDTELVPLNERIAEAKLGSLIVRP